MTPASGYEWSQTLEEVTVLVRMAPGTKASAVQCKITIGTLALRLSGSLILDGPLWAKVHADECLWTVEDDAAGRFVRLVLVKARAAEVWSSVIRGTDELDALAHKAAADRLRLESLQHEHAGFDFSEAVIT